MYKWESWAGVEIGSGTWDNIKDRSELNIKAGFDYGVTEKSEVGISADIFRAQHPGKAGVGDATIHYKHIFWDPPSWEPLVAFDLKFKIPTASSEKDLGTGRPSIELHVLVGWKRDPWETNIDLGYIKPINTFEDSVSQYGVATRYHARHNLWFLGELWAQGNKNPFLDDKWIVSGGVSHQWTPFTTLDFLASIGISESVPDVGVRFGFITSM